MAAPERIRGNVRFFSLALRARSIHGTKRRTAASHNSVAMRGTADMPRTRPARRSDAFDLGCVKTLRGMTAPGILMLVVTFRAKKCRNLSSALHYDQIRFRFFTA